MTKKIFLSLACILVLAGCKRSGKESKIVGTVNYNGAPMNEVMIEIYLKAEKDKSVPPFITGETDKSGEFEIILPPGTYFIIAKKRFIEGGIMKMLLGEYPKNPVEVAGSGMVRLSPFSLFNMGEDKRLDIEGSGITGRVTLDGGDVGGSFIYVYPEANPKMIGPAYVVSQEIEKDGTFKINLLQGNYYVAVRQRESGTKLGYLKLGDFAVEYGGNPAEVKPDKYLDLGELKLHQLDEKKLELLRNDKKGAPDETKVTGRITDEDNEPVQGIFVYAYKDPKMVGKPEAISIRTDEQGRYTLFILAAGKSSQKYFIGARTNFGGPLEPGEYIGTYNENPEHSLEIGADKQITDINITVKEVW